MLTDKGLSNVWIVASYLFSYLEMLKKVGPQQWLFEEIKKINKLKFEFANSAQGMTVAAQLSKRMHEVPIEEVLFKEYFMEEWHPELIVDYLGQLSQKNLRVVIPSEKEFEKECTLVEPIYGTKYAVEVLPEIKLVKCEFKFPPANEFFPTDLTIQPPTNTRIPIKLSSTPYMDVYFKPNHQFNLPKGQVKLRIYYNGENTIEHIATKDIYEKMLANYLRDI
jgi:secreted Zn-dependent insulinase-like peptidase